MLLNIIFLLTIVPLLTSLACLVVVFFLYFFARATGLNVNI